MSIKIACIPADKEGNKLWLRDLVVGEDGLFVQYKTTYNDMPWQKCPLFLLEDEKTLAITGDDGTILYSFSIEWIGALKSD